MAFSTTLFLFLLIKFLLATQAASWKLFHRGTYFGDIFSGGGKIREVEDKWFTQVLDHFNRQNNGTWKQRYFINDRYYSAGGPVFLMIGAEGPASKGYMNGGSWIKYAERFGALLFQLEHRYYGESRPTENLSVQNLQYLSSQQALADLANFIVAMNEKYDLPPNVKWIVFGGSYGGSLAAWLRMKYPHLVYGAVSSSGPLLAVLDFKDYYRVVAEALRDYDKNCVKAVEEAFKEIDRLIQDQSLTHSLDDTFQLCHPIKESVNNFKDISLFYESLAANFAAVVQTHPHFRKTIDEVCHIMTNKTIGAPINRLSTLNRILNDDECFSYKYQKFLDYFNTTTWPDITISGGRPWLYQTCTEFGFYQTSSYYPNVFGDKLLVEYYVQGCQDVFGNIFDMQYLNSKIRETNAVYGGLNISVSRVVFLHGSIDPWHAIGITRSDHSKTPVILIKGASHCADMRPEHPSDPNNLKIARKQIGQNISSWLKSKY